MTGPPIDHARESWTPRGSGGITSREENDASVWKSIPGFAKIVMLLQTLVILFLSFWIYQEYLNNSYFQVYVNGYLQGGSLNAIILVAIGLFTTVAIGLYAKLRSTRRELGGLLSRKTAGRGGSGIVRSLDTRTEEHLISMIRKTLPVMGSGSEVSGEMPTLKRTDS